MALHTPVHWLCSPVGGRLDEKMRKTGDRIRHAISFEVIALALVTPLGAIVFGKPMLDMSVITILSATIAMLWNYVYNLGFDHAAMRLIGRVRKSILIRIFHAILFEAGLLIFLVPLIMWYLAIGIWPAFLMDISFSVFYLVYAFVFNWGYDVIFPLPEPKQANPR